MKIYNLTIVINDHIIYKKVRASSFKLVDNRYIFYGGEYNEYIVLEAPKDTIVELYHEVGPTISTVDVGNEANWSC